MPEFLDLPVAASVESVDQYLVAKGGVPMRATAAVAFEGQISAASPVIRSEITSSDVTTALTFTPADNALANLSSPATARGHLGSTSVGDALFVASDAAAGRLALGLGSASLLTAGVAVGNAVVVQAGSKLPALDGSLLSNVVATPGIVINGKTAGYTALTTDLAKIIEYTGAGGVTLALTAAATLGAQWWCEIDNRSTGIITIDPNGSETIDGRATILVYPDERFRIRCDGTLFRTNGRQRRVLVQTVATTSGAGPFVLETAFGDSEAVSIDFELDYVVVAGAAAGVVRAQFKQSGSYVTTSSYTLSYFDSQAAAFNSTSSTGITLTYSAATHKVSGRARLHSPFSAAANGPTLEGSTASISGVATSSGSLAATGAIQGAQFGFTGLTPAFSAGSIRSYINRE